VGCRVTGERAADCVLEEAGWRVAKNVRGFGIVIGEEVSIV